ncbi:MAG: hypothetical protein KAS67_04185 [Thermoplasmata archaeon]|nr:hypothetical protein [Thermoplasmata archaeon]
MGVRVILKNSVGEVASSIEVEVEPSETVQSLIETAVNYWGLDNDAGYCVKMGLEMVPSEAKFSDIDLKPGDTMVILDEDRWLGMIGLAKAWIEENIGDPAGSLELKSSIEDGARSTFILENSQDTERSFEVVVSGTRVEMYRPL